MNIFGQPFDSWVRYQITKRQEILGSSTNISSKDLQYYHTKTPWIRLASSVDLKWDYDSSGSLKDGIPKKLNDLGIDTSTFDGNTLAKKAMLFGGALNVDNNTDGEGGFSGLNKGILDSVNNSIFNVTYGWGGTENRGFVPMPGILSAQTQYYNNGAAATTNVSIKCYSRTQMAIIDALYLHPGYTLLLEYGWSTYIDNDGNLQSFDNFYTEPLSFVLNPGDSNEDTTQYSVYNLIKKEKKARFGNYEAVYGKISNFKWQFDSDGSYTCNVTITSMGSIIESLKVNIALSTADDPPSTSEGDAESTTNTSVSGSEIIPLVADAKATNLNKALWQLYQDVKDNTTEDKWYNTIHNDFPDPNNNWEPKKLTISKGLFTIGNTTTTATNNTSPQVYISFGVLLALIQCRLLVYDKNGTKKAPLFHFDFNFDDLKSDTNYMARIPGQMSSDPQTVLIAYDKSNLQDVYPEGDVSNILYPDSTINQHIKKGIPFISEKEDELYVGKMAGMYLNMNYIAECLRTAERSDDKSISVLAFLKQIFFGVEESLGNINSFSVRVNEEDNTIRIYDNAPQRISQFPSDPDKDESYAKINLFGVKPGAGNVETGAYSGEGSFVTNVQLNGELGSNFASAIAIGAQIQGSQLASNATSFSNFNRGLIDRVIPTKVDAKYTADPKDETKIPLTPVEFWNNNIMVAAEGENTLFDQVYTNRLFLNDSISSFKGLLIQFTELSMGVLTSNKQLPFSTFLPFNLSFTMEGLSGMKLWEKFLIDDRVLPPSYDEDSIDFQVSGINHTVDSSAWKTQITTQCAPRSPLDTIKHPQNLDSSRTFQGNAGGGSGGSGGNTSSNEPTSEIPVPAGLDPASETRFNALQKSFVGVFNSFGSVGGMCAQWSYNLALNYCRALKGLDGTITGKKLAAGGNANMNSNFWSNLVKMGYTQTKVGTNISRSRLGELLRSTTWGYGDIVVYYANDGNSGDSHVKYGHAQVYVGELTNSKWSTSTKNNYGTDFVYRSRSSNQWDFYIFRAPATAGGVGTGPGL